MRLHPEPLRLTQPARDKADLHAFHLRHRHYADSIRHGSSKRYASPDPVSPDYN